MIISLSSIKKFNITSKKRDRLAPQDLYLCDQNAENLLNLQRIYFFLEFILKYFVVRDFSLDKRNSDFVAKIQFVARRKVMRDKRWEVRAAAIYS